MRASRIDDILDHAGATAGQPELPEHIRSLATTVRRMATAIAADPAPQRVDVFTLEQAAGILERWVADHRASADAAADATACGGLYPLPSP